MKTIKTLGKVNLVVSDVKTELGNTVFLEGLAFGDCWVGYYLEGKLDLNTRPPMGASDDWYKCQKILKLMGY